MIYEEKIFNNTKEKFSEIFDIIDSRVFFYNDEHPMVLSDVYDYDIERCYTTILKNKNLVDLLNIPKSEANILIGKIIKNNPAIYDILKNETKKIVKLFIQSNNIILDDLIYMERDGFLLTRFLKDNIVINIDNDIYNIRLKNKYSIVIRSNEKHNNFLLLSDNNVRLKGIESKYKSIAIETFLFNNLKRIFNESNKVKKYNLIQKMIHDFFHTDDINLFAVSMDNKVDIYCRDKLVSINKDYLSNSKASEFNIDRKMYYGKLLYPFISVLALYTYNE